MSAVDRCVCRSVTLARGRDEGVRLLMRCPWLAHDPGALFDALRARTGCATGCGRCEPYFRAMLRTGRVEFDHAEPIVQPGADLGARLAPR